MITLDCESFETTYDSIEQICCVNRSRLKNALCDIKNKNIFLEKPGELVLFLQKRIEMYCINEIERTMFFHISRIFDSSVFENGILPLKDIYPYLYRKIKDMIMSIDKEKLPKCNKYIDGSMSFNCRMQNSILGGPCALLIRDMYKCDENSHFLTTPETVQHILSTYIKQDEKDYCSFFMSVTKPCIVKFYSELVPYKWFENVIYYLYCVEKKIPLNTKRDGGFDGKGIKVPKSNIISINML